VLSTSSLSNHDIKIVEVGPRDGLQNESAPVTTDQKVQLIQQLARAGCSYIEAGAFVSPQWVPQMKDSRQVLEQVTFPSSPYQPRLACLVPNVKGLETVLQLRSKVDEVAIFGAASEAFSQRNIGCSIDESIQRFRSVMEMAAQHQIPVRGYVSTVVACPYQGPIAPTQVAKVVEQLLELGCYEISLGDTIGVGTPGSIRAMLYDVLVSVYIGITEAWKNE
jgi:hydroxymethylglutaryl-CoA lyase